MIIMILSVESVGTTTATNTSIGTTTGHGRIYFSQPFSELAK